MLFKLRTLTSFPGSFPWLKQIPFDFTANLAEQPFKINVGNIQALTWMGGKCKRAKNYLTEIISTVLLKANDVIKLQILNN